MDIKGANKNLTLDSLQGTLPQRPMQPQAPAAGFADLLKQKVDSSAKVNAEAISSGVKFSNHAIERIQSRGIKMGPEELSRLNAAVDRAAEKGARDTLVLMGDSAMIVSIKNKTVVTAMDSKALKENVFTNIDSTVVI